jgi:hypothetical protein
METEIKLPKGRIAIIETVKKNGVLFSAVSTCYSEGNVKQFAPYDFRNHYNLTQNNKMTKKQLHEQTLSNLENIMTDIKTHFLTVGNGSMNIFA